MASKYAVTKLKLRAVIGGVEFKDVVQFAAGFEMNAIPIASIMVAVGNEVTTQEAATIHDAISNLKIQVPAEVFLETEDLVRDGGASSGLEEFDGSEKRIFDGYAVGTGWRRTTETANFVIHLTHWLADLHYSSAISGQSHPGNPVDWAYPAAYAAARLGGGGGAGGKGGGSPTWVPMIGTDEITEGAIESDFWEKVLKKWMMTVAGDDPMDFSILGGNDSNGKTVAALERVKSGVPLAFDLEGADGSVISEALRVALFGESATSWVNTTLWGKLIGDWSPSYWFAVVPRVEDALVVPFCGGLQGEPWKTIEDDDYVMSDLNCQLHQVLRCVGILHAGTYWCGGNGDVGHIQSKESGVAGFFQPADCLEGLVLFKDAPAWLSTVQLPYSFTMAAEGLKSGEAIGNAMDPEDTGPDEDPFVEGHDLVKTRDGAKSMLDKYAHQWYVLEMLKGRTGELSGKIRFDIAPGSNVKIEGGAAQNVDGDRLAEPLFATVQRVSIVINAESQKAGTTFSLAHIRTEAENGDAKTSVDRPPMYTKKWVGDELLGEAAEGDGAEPQVRRDDLGNIVPPELVNALYSLD